MGYQSIVLSGSTAGQFCIFITLLVTNWTFYHLRSQQVSQATTEERDKNADLVHSKAHSDGHESPWAHGPVLPRPTHIPYKATSRVDYTCCIKGFITPCITIPQFPAMLPQRCSCLKLNNNEFPLRHCLKINVDFTLLSKNTCTTPTLYSRGVSNWVLQPSKLATYKLKQA